MRFERGYQPSGSHHYLRGSSTDFYHASDFASDSVFGGNGNDNLDGADASADFLRAEAGNDTIYVSNDDAAGGSGNDFFLMQFGQGGRMTGGTGSDTFVVQTSRNQVNNTVITDFNSQDNIMVEYSGGGEFGGGPNFVYGGPFCLPRSIATATAVSPAVMASAPPRRALASASPPTLSPSSWARTASGSRTSPTSPARTGSEAGGGPLI
jgi:hypothetical protein